MNPLFQRALEAQAYRRPYIGDVAAAATRHHAAQAAYTANYTHSRRVSDYRSSDSSAQGSDCRRHTLH